jgi:hypothetical protein
VALARFTGRQAELPISPCRPTGMEEGLNHVTLHCVCISGDRVVSRHLPLDTVAIINWSFKGRTVTSRCIHYWATRRSRRGSLKEFPARFLLGDDRKHPGSIYTLEVSTRQNTAVLIAVSSGPTVACLRAKCQLIL